MSVRLICVVFLVCQFSCFGTSTSPYGSDSNGHVGKKGRPEPRHQDKDRPKISESQTCINDFTSRSNYIIRTTESLENDALFIDSIKVESSEICIENCCETNGNEDESSICDVAVFVNSDDAAKNRESNCFLFQCRFETAEGERNRCKFAEHDGYVSNMYGGFEEEAVFPDRVRNKQQEVKEKIKEEEEIPQTKQPAPKITESGGDIVETESEDSDEKDVPQACNDEHQFQCDNGDCIRLTLLCDDYNDCADYSDEKDATCKELDGEVEPSRNSNESEEAKAPPTNPPKPHTTNNNNRRPVPTTTIPESKEDDSIFSELAQQLHKEGAKQKMKDKTEEKEKEEEEEEDLRQDDWDALKDEPNEDGSENRHNDWDDDRQDYDWRQRQRGQTYNGYNRRPNRPRPYDRYNYDERTSNEDEYRDYPNRHDEDEDQGDMEGETERKDDGDDDDEHDENKNKTDEQNNRKDHDVPDGKSEDEDKQQTKDSDATEKMNDKVEDSERQDKWQTQQDSDDTKGSGQKELSRTKQKGLESTMEDWYGKDQPDKNTVPGGSGRDDDYNKDNYHDYFGNYYDRNRYRGYPNRYRYPYPPGGRDYQDYVDYNHVGNGRMPPPPPGRGGDGTGGRGRGGGHNWSQSRNQDGDFHNEDGGDSTDELDDKLQGDDQDSKKTSTADAPHSRRLRPGLYKIWQYMYDNSAADYATDYPPAAPGGQDKDKIETNEDGIANEHTGMGVDDNEKEIVKIPTTNKILKTEQDNGDSPVEVELMETQKSGPPSEDPISDQSSSSSNSKSGSKSSEVKEKTGTKTENTVANSDVRVTDAQSAVTATAVLPLTIGLFLTLFLLLMMSCRLRYMNRRLRYGRLKTNNAHDADYLINGMYL